MIRLPARLLATLLLAALAGGEELALVGGGSAAVVRLEGAGLAVAMVPGLGGKLISLRGPDGYEWLSRSARPYRPRAGVVNFGDAEFDGADEVFPTMDPCDGLPGHGEVWRLAWERAEGPGLTYAATGSLRPYRFTRSLTIEPGAVVLSYELVNRGDAELRYYYLFHPLFSIAEPLRLELPPEQTVRVTNSQHHFLHESPALLPWSSLVAGPFAEATASMSGKRFWSLEMRPAPGFMRLRRPGGAALTMTWDAATLPCAEVWCSEASPFVGDLAHLAPEPCTGPSKKLSDAVADGTAATLAPGATRRWRLRLAFTSSP